MLISELYLFSLYSGGLESWHVWSEIRLSALSTSQHVDQESHCSHPVSGPPRPLRGLRLVHHCWRCRGPQLGVSQLRRSVSIRVWEPFQKEYNWKLQRNLDWQDSDINIPLFNLLQYSFRFRGMFRYVSVLRCEWQPDTHTPGTLCSGRVFLCLWLLSLWKVIIFNV